MTNSEWKLRVPGKLMIAGEYAILEPRQHAVVMAVDRYITVELKESKENILSLPQLGLREVTWINDGVTPIFNRGDSRLKVIQQALKTMNQYFREQSIEIRNCRLTITSELVDIDGRKYGLGSSAAITVAVVASLLAFHRIQLPCEQLFKLAALSHLLAQGNGSGADIAAATYGGLINYTAFRPNWLLGKWKEGTKLNELLETSWPQLSIRHITLPAEVEIGTGWTKVTARTGPMVQKIQRFRLTEPHQYHSFLQESSRAVTQFVKGIETCNFDRAMVGISQNRQALRRLGAFTNVLIETPKLTRLCEIGEKFGSAKPSGAGGGDCGIALIQKQQKSLLHEAWRKEGIIPLHVSCSQKGFVVMEMIRRS
ncbi:phosphomevalonate kinase [Bacillus tuaregi]|uniref:phosphomevalonate kinase n=1 Tax=Bacillus tuaregi TaxID=1816695 RepID=UPI0008F85422|nr:phosphomevalonate kinase [Bacillus tuaregi]